MNPCVSALIGPKLIDSLTTALQAGEFVAVLGGRFVGKRLLLRRLREQLAKAGEMVQVASFLDPTVENEFPGTMADRFLEALPTLRSPDQVVRWCEENGGKSGGPRCHLLIANLDSLTRHEALPLIERLQTLRRGGILFTAEASGAELLVGPTPQVRCDQVVVVSGFEEKPFAEFASRYLRQLRLARLDKKKRIRRLYEQTGGKIYFLRALLWAAVDHWASQEGSEPLDLEAFPEQNLVAQIPWNHYLRHVTRLIGNRPELWPRLETLLGQGWVEAAPSGPDFLELTGIPLREPRPEGDRLRVSGFLLEGFLRRHYGQGKIAELYAGQGDWEATFRKLELVPPQERIRPAHLDDVPDTASMVRRLAASLHAEATRGGTVAVRRRFEQACRLWLGFSEVHFWERAPRKDARWVLLGEPEATVPEATDIAGSPFAPPSVASVLNRVPQRHESGLELYPFPPEDHLRGLAATLPSRHSHPGFRSALVVRDIHDFRPLSATRLEFLQTLTREFCQAYAHALEHETYRARTQARAALSAAVTEVLSGLGTQFPTIRLAVERAASALRDRRKYRRVLVSLMEPCGTRIRGYYEASDDDHKRLLKLTNYSVDPPAQSVHVHCLKTAQSVPVADFADDVRANSMAAASVQLLAAVVVPLDTGRIHQGQPLLLGTLLVERDDDLPPDDEEVKDLEEFAQKLAGIIEQSERIQLLQSTLDKQREPLMIFDPLGRLRFANASAASHIQPRLTPGWTRREAAVRLVNDSVPQPHLSHTVDEYVALALDHSSRFVGLAQYASPLAQRRESWVVLTDVLEELHPFFGERRPLGVFCEGQNLSFLYTLFDTFKALLERVPLTPQALGLNRVSLIDQFLDQMGRIATRGLNHPEAYYDEYDEASRCLWRRRTYARDTPSGAPEATVRAQQYPLDNRAEWGFQERIPIPYYYDAAGRFEDGAQVVTTMGLFARSVRTAEGCPDGLLPGGLWVDVPLHVRDTRLGRLVLACDATYAPENFELLKVYFPLLVECASAFVGLDAAYALAYANFAKEREHSAREAVRNFRHSLESSFNFLPGLLSDLEAARSDTERRLVCDGLRDFLRRTSDRLELIKRLDSLEALVPRWIDLSRFLRERIERCTWSGSFEIAVPAGLKAVCDDVHLGLALSELVDNSRKYHIRTRVFKGRLEACTFERDGIPWIRIVYEDNGPGIPAPDKERVFARGEIVARPGITPSTGLGLHFVREVLRRHGGDATEEGLEGQGVRFVLAFPGQP